MTKQKWRINYFLIKRVKVKLLSRITKCFPLDAWNPHTTTSIENSRNRVHETVRIKWYIRLEITDVKTRGIETRRLKTELYFTFFINFFIPHMSEEKYW